MSADSYFKSKMAQADAKWLLEVNDLKSIVLFLDEYKKVYESFSQETRYVSGLCDHIEYIILSSLRPSVFALHFFKSHEQDIQKLLGKKISLGVHFSQITGYIVDELISGIRKDLWSITGCYNENYRINQEAPIPWPQFIAVVRTINSLLYFVLQLENETNDKIRNMKAKFKELVDSFDGYNSIDYFSNYKQNDQLQSNSVRYKLKGILSPSNSDWQLLRVEEDFYSYCISNNEFYTYCIYFPYGEHIKDAITGCLKLRDESIMRFKTVRTEFKWLQSNDCFNLIDGLEEYERVYEAFVKEVNEPIRSLQYPINTVINSIRPSAYALKLFRTCKTEFDKIKDSQSITDLYYNESINYIINWFVSGIRYDLWSITKCKSPSNELYNAEEKYKIDIESIAENEISFDVDEFIDVVRTVSSLLNYISDLGKPTNRHVQVLIDEFNEFVNSFAGFSTEPDIEVYHVGAGRIAQMIRYELKGILALVNYDWEKYNNSQEFDTQFLKKLNVKESSRYMEGIIRAQRVQSPKVESIDKKINSCKNSMDLWQLRDEIPEKYAELYDEKLYKFCQKDNFYELYLKAMIKGTYEKQARESINKKNKWYNKLINRFFK